MLYSNEERAGRNKWGAGSSRPLYTC